MKVENKLNSKNECVKLNSVDKIENSYHKKPKRYLNKNRLSSMQFWNSLAHRLLINILSLIT